MIVGLFEALLILPPYLFLNWIKIQIFVINILMCMYILLSQDLPSDILKYI